jgi:uncharacterized protein (TIGR02118 family)
MTAHLLVMYPTPKNPEEFDRAYRDEHLPYAGPRLEGAVSVVSQRIATPNGGRGAYHVISDVAFPSLEVLKDCAASARGKEALAHAASISTGGPPTVLIATDDFGR